MPDAKRTGATYVEFTNKLPPRLFAKKRAASNALTWWLRGHVSIHPVNPDIDDPVFLRRENDMGNVMHVYPISARKKDQYEVVEIEIKICNYQPRLL